MNLAHNQSNLDNPLDRALLAYFYDRRGDWLDRNMVMKKCGFDSPSEHPVGAYAQFANSLIRVNREIAYRSLTIIRDERALDFFSLQSAEYGK
ncbi:hypothetical protein FHS21_001308 [Phyllobacterium trifolii]|uniref:Uncharacterized protein n=1 Tax=Phyllobacterium trifolii TaxID=300193 RepID=A0A839U379_9HYPH|nr:hypothetical protein [Phyllobacterium trifolii]MBB3144907.1 hypothetical protein [Phyllobacterium trifolii]